MNLPRIIARWGSQRYLCVPTLSVILHLWRPVNATLLYAHRTTDVVYRGEIDALRRRHPGLVVRHVVSPERITGDAIRTMAVVEACYISSGRGGTPIPEP